MDLKMANEKWQMKNGYRVAIVHDWLIGGGAERVVEELHKLFPDAPIYTSYCSDEWRQKLAPAPVITGYMQHWPFSKLRKFLPMLRQRWFSKLDLRAYDLIISSSGAEAKGVKRLKPSAVHINYCHAPTHYYWDRYEQYLQHPGFGPFDWLARLGLQVLVGPLRRWDKQAAQRPHVMVANSSYTKAAIKKYYGRDAVVIHPPVDVERFKTARAIKRQGFVAAGRQTPYKRIDLAVAACTKLSLPLTVIGNGPDHKKLIKMAGPTITFVTDASDNDVARHFAEAEAFIFPNADDFGVVAVEAMAAGTPVVAFGCGGALDYVVEHKNGVFFTEQTVDSLAKALKIFKSQEFDPDSIKKHAVQFSVDEFRKNINSLIEKVRANPN